MDVKGDQDAFLAARDHFNDVNPPVVRGFNPLADAPPQSSGSVKPASGANDGLWTTSG